MFEVAIAYSEDIMRVAARRFFLKFILLDYLIAAGIAAFGMALLFGLDLDWRYGAGLCALALFLVVLVTLAGWRYVHASIAKFRSLKSPTVVWRFSNEKIGAKSDASSHEFQWSIVSKVWRFPEVWLLFFGGAGYSVLPVAGLSPQIQEFIVSKVQASGGTVA
jgi:hypothetical protein